MATRFLYGAASLGSNNDVTLTSNVSQAGAVTYSNADLAMHAQIAFGMHSQSMCNYSVRWGDSSNWLKVAFLQSTIELSSNNAVTLCNWSWPAWSNARSNDLRCQLIHDRSNLLFTVSSNIFSYSAPGFQPRFSDAIMSFSASNNATTPAVNRLLKLNYQPIFEVSNPANFQQQVRIAKQLYASNVAANAVKTDMFAGRSNWLFTTTASNVTASNVTTSNLTVGNSATISASTGGGGNGLYFGNANHGIGRGVSTPARVGGAVFGNDVSMFTAGTTSALVFGTGTTSTERMRISYLGAVTIPGTLSVNTLSASNLGAAAFCNVIPYGMVYGAPAQVTTSNYGVLTASNLSASNLGAAAFCNVIPYGMVSGAPAQVTTSNYGVLTASNLSASNLGAAAFCNVIPFSMVTGSPLAGSNFGTLTANNVYAGFVGSTYVMASNSFRMADSLGNMSQVVYSSGNRLYVTPLVSTGGTDMMHLNNSPDFSFGGTGLSSNGLTLNRGNLGRVTIYNASNASCSFADGKVGINVVDPAVPLDVSGTSRFTGNVGVGATPTYPLDVTGHARFQSNVWFNNQGANCVICLYNNAGAIAPGSADTNYYGFGLNASTLRYQVPSAFGNHVFYTGTTEIARFTPTGRFGVNNNNPSYAVDVTGSGLRVLGGVGVPTTVYINPTGASSTTGIVQFVNSGHFIACTDTADYAAIGNLGGAGHKIYYASGSHAFSGGVQINGDTKVTGSLTVGASTIKGIYNGQYTWTYSTTTSSTATITHNLNLSGNQNIFIQMYATMGGAVAFAVNSYSANSFVAQWKSTDGVSIDGGSFPIMYCIMNY